MTRRTIRALVVLVAPLLLLTAPARASNTASHAKWGAEHTFGDVKCRLISRDASAIGKSSCPGVRPGAATYIVSGGHGFLCTLNFIFKGSDGYTYAGTAGHCVKEANYEKRWSGYTGPKAYYNKYGPPYNNINYRSYMGTYAYGVLNGTKDFALIRLARGVKANPKMCYFGGPDGMYTKHDAAPSILRQYGNGFYWGDHYPARTYVAPTMADVDTVYMLGMGGPGDSGSGVVNSNGEAVGVLVAGLDPRLAGIGTQTWPSEVPWPAALMIATRLDSQIARAQKVMRIRLRILSASVVPVSPGL